MDSATSSHEFSSFPSVVSAVLSSLSSATIRARCSVSIAPFSPRGLFPLYDVSFASPTYPCAWNRIKNASMTLPTATPFTGCVYSLSLFFFWGSFMQSSHRCASKINSLSVICSPSLICNPVISTIGSNTAYFCPNNSVSNAGKISVII